MSMISFGTKCRGECKDCASHYGGGCLAGHGDDDFWPVTEDMAKQFLARNQFDFPSTRHQLLRKFPQLLPPGEVLPPDPDAPKPVREIKREYTAADIAELSARIKANISRHSKNA